jgi:hypothetical protein
MFADRLVPVHPSPVGSVPLQHWLRASRSLRLGSQIIERFDYVAVSHTLGLPPTGTPAAVGRLYAANTALGAAGWLAVNCLLSHRTTLHPRG